MNLDNHEFYITPKFIVKFDEFLSKFPLMIGSSTCDGHQTER